MPESGDAGIVHRNEGEIGGHRRGRILGGTDAQVIGNAFEPFGKTGIPKAEADDEREDENGQNYRRAFEPLDFHTVELNKKPAQLKAALVSERKTITVIRPGHRHAPASREWAK